MPTATTTYELKIDTYYVDGDTRALALKNPKGGISSTDIENLNTLIQANNLLIGDKTGATFGRITSASKVTKTTVNYDTESIT